MNDIVNKILAGTATLLSVDDICKRLGVSRTTFDRWVKNGTAISSQKLTERAQRSITGRSPFDDEESSISFPPPDIRIGNSPKWELETFKIWLHKNVTKV